MGWLLLGSPIAMAGCNVKSFENFNTFFSKWSSNKQFSVERTIFPLRTTKYDSGGIEPEPIRGLVNKDEFERSPSYAEYMKVNSLQHSIESVTAKTATVKIFKKGTDWQYEYHFQNRGGCWYFSQIENQSL
jgi:hypothetical protein